MELPEQEKITAILKQTFEDQILHTETSYDFFTIILKRDKIAAVIEYLYNHPDTQFRYLTTLCGIHYAEQHQIAVMYQLHNLVKNQRIRLKTYLPEDDANTQTISHIYAGANWMERETFDFYGVNFAGHPKLKRLLNVDDMIIFPLRKEYPLEDQTREDKTDSMFGR